MTGGERMPPRRAAGWLLLMQLLVPALGAAAQEQALSTEDDALHLRQGTVRLQQGLDALGNLRAWQPGASQRAIIHLDGPINARRRAQLLSAGLEIEGYLTDNSFLCSLKRADRAAVQTIPFIRSCADLTPELKLDPNLSRRAFRTEARRDLDRRGLVALQLSLFAGEPIADLVDWLSRPNLGATVHFGHESASGGIVSVTFPRNRIGLLAARPEILHVEQAPELTDRSNLTSNWIVQSGLPNVTPLHDAGLTGQGQIIGILDSAFGGLDINHCSFSDAVDNTPGPLHRKVFAYNTSVGSIPHATHVSATAAGLREDGVIDDTRGVAFDARIAYSRFPVFDDAPVYAALSLHHSQGARVHSNSWGDDNSGWYTGLARGIDRFCFDNEESFVAFAVSNQTILRTPENAKNLLAVGASGYPAQSRTENEICMGGAGPTSDGRRKPELFAPGCQTVSAQNSTLCGTVPFTGTSMACPAIVGAAALVRQYYTDGYYPTGAAVPIDGFVPTGALIKATLLNASVDMTGVTGYPSDAEGWGRLRADDALFLQGDSRFLQVHDVWNATGLATGEAASYGLDVLGSTESLRITLAWTEPPAFPGAFEVQVNDLDLEVISPAGDVYFGNVFSGGVSVTAGAADDRNNVEQVLIPAPQVGAWSVRVRGAGVNVGRQGYALAINGDIGMAPDPLDVALAPAPAMSATGSPKSVVATVTVGSDSLVPGSVVLRHRAVGQSVFESMPMTDQGAGVFQAFLPLIFCGSEIEYFVEAQGASTGLVTDPILAPTSLFRSGLGVDTTILSDDFETDQGWTPTSPGDTATDGIWQRVNPIGTSAAPENDHTLTGLICWVTKQHIVGQLSSQSDVDGGFFTLTSPLLDLSAAPDAEISYWRWFYSTHSLPEDTMTVDISNDNGGSWTNVESIGLSSVVQTYGGWIPHRFRVSDFVPATSAMRVRFRAADNLPINHLVEGAIDDFAIQRIDCVDVFCLGDSNADGFIDFDDILASLSNWASTSAPGSGSPGDANHDGIVDFDDVTTVLGRWQAPCP